MGPVAKELGLPSLGPVVKELGLHLQGPLQRGLEAPADDNALLQRTRHVTLGKTHTNRQFKTLEAGAVRILSELLVNSDTVPRARTGVFLWISNFRFRLKLLTVKKRTETSRV